MSLLLSLLGFGLLVIVLNSFALIIGAALAIADKISERFFNKSLL